MRQNLIEKIFICIAVIILFFIIGGYCYYKYAENSFLLKEEPTTQKIIESNKQWIENNTVNLPSSSKR